ncbi:MAG: catalase [Gammaproteobacteria bacterium]|nr:catalase [Gammaproteobacteria bacterium]
MVINPPSFSLPISTANLPTEAVRSETRLQERVPEPSATTENVRSRASVDESTNSSPRAEARNNGNVSEQAIAEREGTGDNAEQEDGRSNDQQRQGQSDPTSRREAIEQREEQVEINQLKARDREVRAHEAAHAAVGGNIAGAPSYEFQRGPDGRRYAVAGEVPIDVAAVPGDPAATIRKMQQVRRAALAPVDPSSQDQAVAAQATAREAQARAELQAERSQEAERSETSQTRFEGRLRRLGVIESPPPGERLSVVA